MLTGVFLAFLVGIAVLIAAGVRWTKILRKRTAENLQKLAGQLSLEVSANVGPAKEMGLKGSLGGKPVEIFSYATSNGKSSTPWIAIAMPLGPAVGLAFTFHTWGIGSKVMELFSVHEVTVGDPAFDRVWFVRTNRPDFLKAALIPELREKMMAVFNAGCRGVFELKAGVLKYTEAGSFSNPVATARLPALAGLERDLADVAEVAGP